MAVVCSDARPSPRDGRSVEDPLGGDAHARARRVRARAVWPWSLLCALGLWLALSSASAFALSQRGHTFSFSFAAQGAPTGIAVDESNGHLYVARKGAPSQAGCAFGCVDEYAPGGPEGEQLVGT